jgi:hypothetical protein
MSLSHFSAAYVLSRKSTNMLTPAMILPHYLVDKRDGESVAVPMKADAPGQDGVRRRVQA